MTPVLTAIRRGPESTASVMLQQVSDGLRLDLAGYDHLRELLEEQFHAAMKHDAEQMSLLSARILAQVAELDVQRARRRELLIALLGSAAEPTVRLLLDRLPKTTAQSMAVLWRALEQALSGCKTLNLRNCQLISEQQALMQQLLGREEHVYAQR